MTTRTKNTTDLVSSSYEIAWQEYYTLPGLTPNERMFGSERLRSYIEVMADIGERDPIKIPSSALGMMHLRPLPGLRGFGTAHSRRC